MLTRNFLLPKTRRSRCHRQLPGLADTCMVARQAVNCGWLKDPLDGQPCKAFANASMHGSRRGRGRAEASRQPCQPTARRTPAHAWPLLSGPMAQRAPSSTGWQQDALHEANLCGPATFGRERCGGPSGYAPRPPPPARARAPFMSPLPQRSHPKSRGTKPSRTEPLSQPVPVAASTLCRGIFAPGRTPACPGQGRRGPGDEVEAPSLASWIVRRTAGSGNLAHPTPGRLTPTRYTHT